MSLFSPKAPAALLALASGVGLVALAAVVTHEPKRAPEPLKPRFEAPAPNAEPAPRAAPRAVRKTHHDETPAQVDEASLVRVVALDGDEPKLTGTLALKPGEDAHTAALQASVKGLGYPDVRILKTSVENGVLIADVSPSLREHGFGSMAESNFIKGVQLTLAQFPDVKSFQLRCDGQILDTLGHFEMTAPTPVREGATSDASARP